MADGPSAVELVDADIGGISFTDVRFGYGPDREILKGLTFEASCELRCWRRERDTSVP